MAQEKSLSSSVLNMKFMQRAAASSSPSTPRRSDEHASKRQRLSNGSAAPRSSHTTPIVPVLTPEQSRGQKEIERQAAELGETKWILSVREPEKTQQRMKVVEGSWAELDEDSASDEDDSEDPDDYGNRTGNKEKAIPGRFTFGKKAPQAKKFGKKSRTEDDEDQHEDENDSSDDSSEEEFSDDEVLDMHENASTKLSSPSSKKPPREGKKPFNQRQRHPARNERSISQQSQGSRTGTQKGACFKCGKAGHKMKDCPEIRSR